MKAFMVGVEQKHEVCFAACYHRHGMACCCCPSGKLKTAVSALLS
jgi:hypothetical protein